jgi:hypothetical protein
MTFLFYRPGTPDYVWHPFISTDKEQVPLISTDKEDVHCFLTRIASPKRSMSWTKVNGLNANTSKFDMNRQRSMSWPKVNGLKANTSKFDMNRFQKSLTND